MGGTFSPQSQDPCHPHPSVVGRSLSSSCKGSRGEIKKSDQRQITRARAVCSVQPKTVEDESESTGSEASCEIERPWGFLPWSDHVKKYVAARWSPKCIQWVLEGDREATKVLAEQHERMRIQVELESDFIREWPQMSGTDDLQKTWRCRS